MITINNPSTSSAISKTITATVNPSGNVDFTMNVTTGSVCDGTLTFIPYSSITFTNESDNGKKVCYKAVKGSDIVFAFSDAIAGIDTTLPSIIITNPDSTPATSKTVTATSPDGTLSKAITAGATTCNASLSFVPYTTTVFTNQSDNGKKICFRAIDLAGNTRYSASSAIAGIDTTAPVITLTGVTPVTIEVGSSYSDAGATATDNLDSSVTVLSSGTVDVNTVGNYTITYAAQDTAGNAAIPVNRLVRVVDTTAPVITLSGANPQTIEVHGAYTELGASASDNYDGNLTGSIAIDTSSVDVDTVGNYTVTYDVTDAHGNHAVQATRLVRVVDTTSPVIAAHGDETAEATSASGATVSYTVPAATDNYDSSVTVLCAPASGSLFALGNTTVTCSATDAHGNAAISTTFKVIIQDTTAPVITVNGLDDMTIEVHAPYADDGATASDAADADVPVVPSGTVDADTVGDYTITYNAMDDAGNAATPKTRTVHVVDTTKPVIMLSGANPQTIEVHGAYTELGATATDNYDGSLTGSIAIDTSAVDTSVLGSYFVTYDVVDSNDNHAVQVVRVVNVVDTTAPVIDPHAGISVQATSESGAVVTYTAPSATDNYDSSVTVICTPTSGSTFPVGNTTVTCTASDTEGNDAEPVTFTVEVTPLCQAPVAGEFRTEGTGAWGVAAHGNNPGKYRDAFFASAFPSGLRIGEVSENSALFTNSAAIQAYLNSGGAPGVLNMSSTNPTSTSSGVLGSQLVALSLSIGFDNYNASFSASTTHLKDLVVADEASPCYGMTLQQVLDVGNHVVAGLPSTFSPDDIKGCIENANQNFAGGSVNNGFTNFPMCLPPQSYCGDGVVELSEQCDDGNRANRDGCSDICETEILPAKLTVTKVVINDNGGTKQVSDFPLFVGTTQVTSGAQNTLVAGTYSVSETGDNAYAATIGGDCAADGSITLQPGDVKSCTITNDDLAAKLTVTKIVINDNGGEKAATDFPLFVGETSVTTGQAHDFDAGTYTVSETADSGYAATFSGDCDADGQVILGVGDVKSCTITNDDLAPKLTVTKVVVNDDGGTMQVSDFPLFVGETQVTSSIENTFNAGTYTVSETNQAHYTGAFSGDCDADGQVSLSIGDVKECTITNTYMPYCGDSYTSSTEACDAGASNGIACTAEYNDQCTYCNADCTQEVTVFGDYCGDGSVNHANEQCDPIDTLTCDGRCKLLSEGETMICHNGESKSVKDGQVDHFLEQGATIGPCAAVCGNRLIQGTETCDDGNTANGDGCDSSCQVEVPPSCGDGSVNQLSESCDGTDLAGTACTDLGYTGGSLGCDASCAFVTAECTGVAEPVCGDGVVGGTEECDDGNDVNNDVCRNDCTVAPSCGNGNLQEIKGEQCDDGNLDDNDGCNSACALEYCGDNVKQTNETCDGTDVAAGYICDADCAGMTLACGNGVLDDGETCDVGTTVPEGKTCNLETCQLEDAVCTPQLSTLNVVSDTQTILLPGGENAALAWEPFGSEPSYWDTNLNAGFTAADWIWQAERVEHPESGEVRTFKRTFDVSGTPENGVLRITADNGYEIWLNGQFVGSDGVSGDWKNSDLSSAYVSGSAWQGVETYNVTPFLEQGTNTLIVIVANARTAGGTQDTNPAGLLYELNVDEMSVCDNSTGGDVCASEPEYAITFNDPGTIYAGEDFSMTGSVQGEGDLNGTLLVNGDPTGILLGDWMVTFTTPNASTYTVDATYTTPCGKVYENSIILPVSIRPDETDGNQTNNTGNQTGNSTDQNATVSTGLNLQGGGGDCSWGYHKEGDQCVKNPIVIKPTVTRNALEPTTERNDTEETGTGGGDNAGTPGNDGNDGNLLTGAVTGGGTSNWIWLAILGGFIAIGAVSYFMMRRN